MPQNCRHFADDIFKCIFLNENVRISLKDSGIGLDNSLVPTMPYFTAGKEKWMLKW